jgi:hypothetical protein
LRTALTLTGLLSALILLALLVIALFQLAATLFSWLTALVLIVRSIVGHDALLDE